MDCPDTGLSEPSLVRLELLSTPEAACSGSRTQMPRCWMHARAPASCLLRLACNLTQGLGSDVASSCWI